MQVLRKIWQRLGDPVFYRKKWRDFRRSRKSFDDQPKARSVEELGKCDQVVAVVAHPDDETFCSGLLCELIGKGATVRVLCLTRGEGGPTGGVTREELGRVREEEMRRSCEALGVEAVEFLDHLDPMAKGFRVYAPDVSAADLSSQILPWLEDADLVISHGSSGEYWHPGHLLIHRATALAMRHCPQASWISFLARHPNHPMPRLLNLDDPAFLALDVSGLEEPRWKALSCHASQLGLFAKFAGGNAEDFIKKTGVETYCLQRPATVPESD